MIQGIGRFGHRFLKILRVLVIASGLLSLSAVAGPVDPPATEVLNEARTIVQRMVDNPRGPYSRIRWYCNDGAVLPPAPYACREHGGGRQHAEYSPDRERLAELGWSVGTILAPLSFEALLEQQPRAQRLRELPLEQYMVDIDDGWVLRRAQAYRGRVQVEDEVAAGRKILLGAVSDPQWLAENYLLVRELARVIPHGEDSDLARRVRRSAIELAELDSSAERWRAEIHSAPTAATAGKIRAWAKARRNSQVAEFANALADDLDLLYGERGRRARLNHQLSQLRGPETAAWQKRVVPLLSTDNGSKVVGLCEATADARRNRLAEFAPSDRLMLLDVLGGLETEVLLASAAMNTGAARSRADILSNASALLHCVYGAGLLSAGELAVIKESFAFVSEPEVSLASYQAGIGLLKRVPGWAAGNVRYTFAEALVHYGALDARSARFSDDLLRGSPLWPLGDVIKTLSYDLGTITGSRVEIAGTLVGSAIALNPGLARGRLRIYETLDAAEAAEPAPGDIIALPETIAELKPVAGILTLGEGNALSHVQLLARNFGIPNVAIDFETIDLIKPLEGQEVVLIVSSDGNVALRAASEVADLIEPAAPAESKTRAEQITVPAPNLKKKSILALAEIGRDLSGKVVGPKAANLGELNRLFPGRVAPALAIPFGVYASHLEEHGLRQRIQSVYSARALGKIDNTALDLELSEVRQAIANLGLSETLKSELASVMESEFGPAGSYGVFVRSDTNVEDLPQFTGAGLSETVANVVGLDAQFRTVPRVWASVLSPRALAWRSSLLTNPEEIYASILLMKSVPSDKSGVLVTTNLATPSEAGMTVSTAWGVGGAVAGEAAESIVLKPDGTVQLMSEAKTPYRRKLAAEGGVEWLPAAAGRILMKTDIEQLRGLAAEVEKKYEPVFDQSGQKRPWDIEFGFVDGELTLFQIRPLVEKNSRRADLAIHKLFGTTERKPTANATVDMTASVAEIN